MSSIAISTSPLTALQTYARLLAVDPSAAAAYADALPESQRPAGLAILAATTSADVQRALALPRADRSYRDTFRTR